MALGWGVHQVMEICIALLSLSIQFGTVTAKIEGEFANLMQLQLRGEGIRYPLPRSNKLLCSTKSVTIAGRVKEFIIY